MRCKTTLSLGIITLLASVTTPDARAENNECAAQLGAVADLGAAVRTTTPPSPGPGVVDITSSNWKSIVEQSKSRPVLVDVWASWCGPVSRGPTRVSGASSGSCCRRPSG